MNEFRADLHCHSTCSDGTLTPSEIVSLAKKIRLSGLSITDHDTVEAYSIAAPLAKELGIKLLTGVEFSTVFQDSSIHLLGYGFEIDHPAISELCARHKSRREDRNKEILRLLARLAMPISMDELREAALCTSTTSKSSVGRPHIALAMIKKGYVKTIKEAFQKYIGDNRPCFVRGLSFTPEETIEVIHKAKGVAIIAHPHLIQKTNLIHPLMQLNFDGIECYYGRFFEKDHERWLRIAEKRNWLVTGGSDFHGDIKPELPLGASWINEERFQILRDRTSPKI